MGSACGIHDSYDDGREDIERGEGGNSSSQPIKSESGSDSEVCTVSHCGHCRKLPLSLKENVFDLRTIGHPDSDRARFRYLLNLAHQVVIMYLADGASRFSTRL